MREWAPDPPEPPRQARHISQFTTLKEARRFLAQEADRSGLIERRIEDFLIAANEVITNALVHGDGVVDIAVWTEEDRLICQVDDKGGSFDDLMAGYRPPRGEVTEGRGLWVARQLVDLVQIGPGRRGTRVRLQLKLT